MHSLYGQFMNFIMQKMGTENITSGFVDVVRDRKGFAKEVDEYLETCVDIRKNRTNRNNSSHQSRMKSFQQSRRKPWKNSSQNSRNILRIYIIYLCISHILFLIIRVGHRGRTPRGSIVTFAMVRLGGSHGLSLSRTESVSPTDTQHLGAIGLRRMV